MTGSVGALVGGGSGALEVGSSSISIRRGEVGLGCGEVGFDEVGSAGRD